MNRKPDVVLMLHAHLPWILETREEFWLHEAVLDCYLPLLEVLESAPRGRLTLSVTATLSAMWADAGAQERTHTYLSAAREKATGWHREAAAKALSAFEERGSLVERLAALARDGRVELIGSGVTHGFLPLLMTVPEAADAQVALGVEAVRRAFGAAPAGFWLPECAYAPGLSQTLAAHGVRYTFVDSHAVEASARGTAAPVFLPSGVAAFARDAAASEQVWSSQVGYPGDPLYADFHHRVNGERVLRVTGATQTKQPWHAAAALERAREHAADFLRKREAGPKLQVAPYDAELFGHWWLEGPAFLEAVLRDGECLTTASAVLAREPTLETRELPFSSWGRDGAATVWLGPQNGYMWPHLHRAAEAMRELGDGPRAQQALQSLLLAQASDWPFLVDAKTSAGFAQEQFERHLLAFRELAAGRDAKTNNPFPWASVSVYRGSRDGKAQPAQGRGHSRAGADAPAPRRVGQDRSGAGSRRRRR